MLIKKICFDNNLTQQDFAKFVSATQSQVSDWMLGKSKPGYDSLRRICQGFNLDANIVLDLSSNNVDETFSKYTVVDLFAGVGGLSYGFANNDKFEIVMANEYDKDIAKAYTLNHPNVKMLNCDIKLLDEKLIKEYIKVPVDVVVGGPPCQSYSTLGKRQDDDRAHLFEEYCRVLAILKPKLFIFENVTGLLSMQNGKLFKTVQEVFNNIGYNLKFEVLNAADYGVPEIRERVILVGTQKENNFVYPEKTHGKYLIPYVTLEDALSDLPVIKSGESSDVYAKEPSNEFQKFVRNSVFLTEYVAPKNNEKMIELMKALPDGGTKDDLPEHLRPKSGFGNTYAKMWWKKPAPTITRNFACPSSSRCIHPRDSRALTTREGARLQSFPDDYKFYGSVGKKNLEIGNAVPPLLSVALARQVEMFLKDEK